MPPSRDRVHRRRSEFYEEEHVFLPIERPSGSGQSRQTEAAVKELAEQRNKLVQQGVQDTERSVQRASKVETSESRQTEKVSAKPRTTCATIAPHYIERYGTMCQSSMSGSGQSPARTSNAATALW